MPAGSFPTSGKNSQSLLHLKCAEKHIWKTCGKVTLGLLATFMLATLPVDVNIWKAQSKVCVYCLLRTVYHNDKRGVLLCLRRPAWIHMTSQPNTRSRNRLLIGGCQYLPEVEELKAFCSHDTWSCCCEVWRQQPAVLSSSSCLSPQEEQLPQMLHPPLSPDTSRST